MKRSPVAILSCALALAGCGGGGGGGTSTPPPPAPSLTAIHVTPANATLTTGQQQQFAATATYSDSSSKDVTTAVTWSSSPSEVASISSGGLISTADSGLTTVTATANGTSGSTGLTVNMPIPPSWMAAGVDYGLKKQCIRTVSPTLANFFSDNTDCSGSAYPTSGYWTTAVETEVTAATPCIGATDQSFPINGPASPVTEIWTGSNVSGYSLDLNVNFANVANPCLGTTFTWVPLMDNTANGGALPAPNQLIQQFIVNYTRALPEGSGATHAFAGSTFQWNAGGTAGQPTPVSIQIAVDFFIDEPEWGKQAGSLLDVISLQVNQSANPPTYFVDFDGSKLAAPIVAALGSPTTLTVNWAAVVQHAIDEGLIPAPFDGWTGSNAVTYSTYVGTEVQNKTTGIGGPTANLLISDYQEGSF